MEINEIQKKEYQWFLDNHNDLYNKYGDAYLVIKNETVLGSYPTFSEGINAVRKKEVAGTYIVHKCGKTKDADAVSLYSHNVI